METETIFEIFECVDRDLRSLQVIELGHDGGINTESQ